MTTRLRALTVVLEKEMREEDAESLILAIRQLRGVADVATVEANVDSRLAEMKAKNALRERITDFLTGIYRD